MRDHHHLGWRLRALVEGGQHVEDRFLVGEIEGLLDPDLGRGTQCGADGGECFARAGSGRAQDQVRVQIARGKPLGHRVGGALAPFVQRPVEIVQKGVFPERFRMPQQEKSLGFQNVVT